MFEGFAETDQNSSSPEYQVLARRTRPQSFSELVGQESAVKAIEGMIQSGRIPHAFLFTGTRGTGKTSSARILAKSLCCERGPTLEPCQTCTHCVQITACAHEDVFEIDGASHTGVDNIRELRESARFFPQSSRYKIFIIDEVHMLSIGAFNALLKTLEEPPPQVVFILATTELHKVPVTVRSRCMILSFRKIDPATIAQHLANVLQKDKIEFSQDALQLIAREAKGSLRDSLSLLEQVLALGSHQSVTFEAAKAALSVMGEGICQGIFEGILQKNVQMCMEALAEIDASSLDFSHVLEQTALLFRNAVVLKQASQNTARVERANEFLNLLPAELAFVTQATANISTVALIEIYRALAHASREILRTNSPRAWAEITLMDCISRSEWLSSDDLSTLLSGTVSHAPQNLTIGSAPRQDEGPSPRNLPTAKKDDSNNPRAGAGVGLGTNTQTSAGVGATSPQNIASGMLDLYASLIAQVQNRNVQLAVKLKHAKLTKFTQTHLVFSDCSENKLFAQLSEPEAEIFLAALSEIGCSQCHIEGLELPSKLSQKRQASLAANTNSAANAKNQQIAANPAAMTARESNATISASSSTSPSPSKTRPSGKTLEAIASLSREDPFGGLDPKKAEEKKNRPASLSSADDGVSLVSVEQAEQAKKWQIRQAEVRAKPLLKKLEDLGAEVEVLPLDAPER